MKTHVFRTLLGLGILAAWLASNAGMQAGDTPPSAKELIYDESADGFKQIDEALAQAARGGKRVLLQFGANWCPWCHKLHTLFKTDKDIAAKIKRDYVVVLIDVNKEHNNEVVAKYGHPTSHGIPAIVILDAEGKKLTTKDTGELEEGDHHSPVKVMAFLEKWSPK